MPKVEAKVLSNLGIISQATKLFALLFLLMLSKESSLDGFFQLQFHRFKLERILR